MSRTPTIVMSTTVAAPEQADSCVRREAQDRAFLEAYRALPTAKKRAVWRHFERLEKGASMEASFFQFSRDMGLSATAARAQTDELLRGAKWGRH